MRTTPEHPSPAAIHEKSDTAESADVPEFAPIRLRQRNIWFANRFPKVHKNYGGAPQIKDRHGQSYVANTSEDFFAGTLSSDGSPISTRGSHGAAEGRFYAYNPETRLYMEQTEHALAARLSPTLLLCAQEAGKEVNVGNLIYRFRKTGPCGGVSSARQGTVGSAAQFFRFGAHESIRLTDLKLLPFSPATTAKQAGHPLCPGVHAQVPRRADEARPV